MLRKKKLIEYFESGIKSDTELKIGTEHEKFILNKSTLKPLSYNEKNGIGAIFSSLKDMGWKSIYDEINNKVVGLINGQQNISLEPAGQFELSGQPLENIHQTCDEITSHLNQMKELSLKHNFTMLGIGVEPSLDLKDFYWMPKERYTIMREYMPKVGKNGLDMMQRTCSTQVNLDFSSEQDMIKKFRVLLSLESIGTAIFANSPFVNKKLSDFKSLRSLYWMNTDNQRTGILPFVFDKDFNFETYTDYALDVPMYFIKRNDKYINLAGCSFRTFMEGKLDQLPNDTATYDDWKNHLTTLFPQVRLKQYLELRSMDACSWNEICGQPAFWTGLLYDKECLEETYILTQNWTNDDRLYLYENVPQHGLATPFKNGKVIDIAKILLKISQRGLKNRNCLSSSGDDERKYLENIEINLDKNSSPADTLIDKYNHKWKKSIKPIYEENIF
tara:strand:- start:200 stop:1537 length:1338 start_codon:yes stop_codon:yes gene_type:complete